MSSLFSLLTRQSQKQTASTEPALTVPASTVPASTVPASAEPASTVPASAEPASEVFVHKSIAGWFPHIARAILNEFGCSETYVERLETYTSYASRSLHTITTPRPNFELPKEPVCRAAIGHPDYFNILTHLMWLGQATSEPLVNRQRVLAVEDPIVASFNSVQTSLLEKEFRVSKKDYLIQTLGYTKSKIDLAVKTMLNIGTAALQTLLKGVSETIAPVTTTVIKNALRVAESIQSASTRELDDVSLELCNISQTLAALATLPAASTELPHGFPKIVTQMRPDNGDYLAEAFLGVFTSPEQWSALMEDFRYELLGYEVKVGLDAKQYFNEGNVAKLIDAMNEVFTQTNAIE